MAKASKARLPFERRRRCGFGYPYVPSLYTRLRRQGARFAPLAVFAIVLLLLQPTVCWPRTVFGPGAKHEAMSGARVRAVGAEQPLRALVSAGAKSTSAEQCNRRCCEGQAAAASQRPIVSQKSGARLPLALPTHVPPTALIENGWGAKAGAAWARAGLRTPGVSYYARTTRLLI